MADLDVFINCPFDDEFEPLFEAIVFVIHASLYRARCALEEDDSSDMRLDRLIKLIADCPRSVHDLSRTQANERGLPRFNMPLELGMYLGAKYFGKKAYRKKSALILEERHYELPSYTSDLGGNDPKAHDNDVLTIIGAVRDYLQSGPEGVPLPGAKAYADGLVNFKQKLPEFLEALKLDETDARPFRKYRNFAYLLVEYLQNEPIVT